MGWMYARGQEVALFVDDRYYEGVSKRLNEREIASEKFGNIKVTVYNTKEKIHRILEVFEMLKKNQGTAEVRVPTGLVVGQIQEMYKALRDPKLKGFSLNFESQASAQVLDTARNIVSSSQESSVHQKQKNIFITDHKAGMRDDHFLYYLGIDPEFGCMSIYKSEMVLVLPQSLKSTMFDESFIAARLGIKKISLRVSYVADRKSLVTTALSGLKKEQISLSPLMTFDQLLEVVTSAGNNTLCMNR